ICQCALWSPRQTPETLCSRIPHNRSFHRKTTVFIFAKKKDALRRLHEATVESVDDDDRRAAETEEFSDLILYQCSRLNKPKFAIAIDPTSVFVKDLLY
ncbi:MAG: hypothetical protein KW804_02515, partial [Candidatus Doudnabacteria bacterium]|nr:hypothetical protein [Candidatus Doudnabacteria bacterium]